MNAPIRSSLGRHVGQSNMTLDEKRQWAREAWHASIEDENDRWLIVRLGDVKGWESRQAAINLGNDVNGKRGK